MRHLATLPEEAARTFADYLLTRKIPTQLEREGDGTAVWVRDDDHVAQARQELAEFNRNPTDPRYRDAASAAEALRRQEAGLDETYRTRQQRFQRRIQSLSPVHRPVTLGLTAISIGVTLVTSFGSATSPIAQALFLSSFRVGLSVIRWQDPFGLGGDIRAGQVWRLITPIFLHLDFLHLLFNMLMLLWVGGAVESRRGSLRLLVLVLVLAVTSNLCQYYLGRPDFSNGWPQFELSPAFGGMSGVLYGLFGYLWMKSRFEPDLGLAMPRETVLIMLAWFVLCLVGVIPRVANAAHASGLLLGLAIGYAPTFWRKLRGDQLDV